MDLIRGIINSNKHISETFKPIIYPLKKIIEKILEINQQ